MLLNPNDFYTKKYLFYFKLYYDGIIRRLIVSFCSDIIIIYCISLRRIYTKLNYSNSSFLQGTVIFEERNDVNTNSVYNFLREMQIDLGSLVFQT